MSHFFSFKLSYSASKLLRFKGLLAQTFMPFNKFQINFDVIKIMIWKLHSFSLFFIMFVIVKFLSTEQLLSSNLELIQKASNHRKKRICLLDIPTMVCSGKR